jgi:hypothetical protein
VGLNTTNDGGTYAGAAGRTVAGNLAGASTAPVPISAALAKLLGSEDALFRDPFADFTSSGR